MALAALPPKEEVSRLASLIQSSGLKNKSLSSICAANGLKSSGVKAEMQNRLVDRIRQASATSDNVTFQAIKRSVISELSPHQAYQFNTYLSGSPSTQSASPPGTNSASYAGTGYSYQNGLSPSGMNGHRVPPVSLQPGLKFKSSPFYEIKHPLGDVRTCDAMSNHRNTIHIPIKLNSMPDLQKCVTDPTMRVMLFCAASMSGPQDITFPHTCEIKVNSGDIKANLRGLKNKPGSTRPVDITDHLRLKIGTYSNTLEFIYALTQKKYYIALFICKTYSPASLVSRIETRNKISKNSVVQEICKKAQDPDVLTTSQVLSLKCPLTYMRLNLPVRSLACKHIQCFDATSYLQLQEQGPQWLCPICNKAAIFENLAVDEYVKDILAQTSKDVDQVTIEETGAWHVKSTEGEEIKSEDNNASYLDDDDDLVITSDVNFSANRSTATPTRSAPTFGTPNSGASREGSSIPRGSGSAKRPAAQVIDLTLSDDDDDDDEPLQPPSKRQKYTNLGGYIGGPGYI